MRPYDEIQRAFTWHVPERCNIAADVCDRWASSDPNVVLAEGHLPTDELARGEPS